jgi:hypothetical protein
MPTMDSAFNYFILWCRSYLINNAEARPDYTEQKSLKSIRRASFGRLNDAHALLRYTGIPLTFIYSSTSHHTDKLLMQLIIHLQTLTLEFNVNSHFDWATVKWKLLASIIYALSNYLLSISPKHALRTYRKIRAPHTIIGRLRYESSANIPHFISILYLMRPNWFKKFQAIYGHHFLHSRLTAKKNIDSL